MTHEGDVSEAGKLWTCAMYGSYHIVVVFCFLDSKLIAGLGFITLVAMGRVFVFLRETPGHFGIIAGVLMHVGLDAAVIFGLASQLYGF